MSKLSYGLNLTKKGPSIASRPPPAKRKTIFDDDSGPEDRPDEEETEESIQMIGGIQLPHDRDTRNSKTSKQTKKLGAPPSKPPRISQYGDLSTNHSTTKHSKGAQEIDPSIYEYDAIYDSFHAKPTSKLSSNNAEEEAKPKHMSSLLAAAEVRKRDQIRAKEKMLAKEREAEGDEFADKEKFVTAAYKRQQEEMRKAELEEAEREKQAEKRRRREGGGLKSLYKSMLEQDEERHQQTMKQIEEMKKSGRVKTSEPEDPGLKVEKSETELAKEKGAIINEEGEVVDRRELLNAGLNAASAPKPKATTRSPNAPKVPLSRPTGGNSGSTRERDTRAFEDQLLGKRSFDSDESEGEAARASKSRKMEDEILAMIGR
ncbi:hypothetical protein G7Y79_00035g070290 [Physcia stellaris]|nr:hypothetical protein G7Y79_00035g070290 [Physcia stellaris]